MDGTSLSVQFPVTPRLRVPRQTYPSASLSATRSVLDGDANDTDDHADDDEDNVSTPRIGTLNVVSENLDVVRSASTTPVVEDSPASRLRALLARVPRDDTPLASAQLRRSPSMHDSDMVVDSIQFSPPFKSTPPSNASASLRDLFSRALREPGDSPREPRRRRRSSLDSSGIEDNPGKTRDRSKRLSLSDDETEKANRSTATSERSFISSQAATFDALRQRLSEPNLNSSKRNTHAMPDNSSHVVLGDVSPNRHDTAPVATSAPLRESISQFPSQLNGSNLLNDDSDMQRYIKDVESDVPTEDDHRTVGQSKVLLARPSNYRSRSRSPLPQERPLSRNGSSDPAQHDRSSSRLSISSVNHDNVNPEKEHLHDLERGWNRPLSAYMDRLDFSSHDLSPGHVRPVLRRHRSSASLASSEDLGRSTGSQSSQNSDRHYRRTSGQLSHGSLDSHSRSSSISPVQIRVSDRTRTISRSNSPKGLQARARTDSSTARERSSSSLAVSRPSFSSHNHRVHDRAISPALSIASQDSEQEKQRELQHVRERNWNSRHPKWSLSEEQGKLARRRSQLASPLPSPTAASRQRHGSLTNQTGHQSAGKPTSPSESRISRNASVTSSLPVPALRRSPSSSSLAERNSQIPRVRPHSPLSLSQPNYRSETSKPSVSSRDERSNVSSRPAVHSPSPTTKSQGINGAFHSHIPVRAKEHRHNHTNGVKRIEVIQHKEEKMEREDEPGRNPSKISISIEPVEMHESDFESFHEEDIAASSTKARISAGEAQFPEKSLDGDDESLSSLSGVLYVPSDNRAQILPANFSPPPSPPVTPSDQVMATPKRRSSLSSSKPDFKSPSPPKGLPELPDPPSSEEADSDRTPPMRTPAAGIRHVDAKTPRPPGGWVTPFATPAPPGRVGPVLAKPDLGTFQTELYTPPASLSRATSLLVKTPAPPGAWLPTPANSKKLQKVRFDEEEASHGQVNEAASPGPNGLSPLRSGEARPAEKNTDTPVKERKENSSPRTPRRISTIRVVDAFGKQIVDTPNEQQSHMDMEDELRNVDPERSDSSVGTKTRIRIVDTIGTQVETPRKVDSTTESSAQENLSSFIEELEGKKLERKQALELLQKTIADLKKDFVRTDIETETTDPAGKRTTDLLTRSQRAREERERLRHEISLAANVQQVTQGKVNDKKASAVSRPLHRAYGIAFWTTMVIVQLLLFLALCRWSSLRARHLFLTTYMDPFYPELQLHITNPDLLRTTSASRQHSSYDTHKISGWMQSITFLWYHLCDSLNALRDILWETSGDPPRTIPWPPT